MAFETCWRPRVRTAARRRSGAGRTRQQGDAGSAHAVEQGFPELSHNDYICSRPAGNAQPVLDTLYASLARASATRTRGELAPRRRIVAALPRSSPLRATELTVGGNRKQARSIGLRDDGHGPIVRTRQYHAKTSQQERFFSARWTPRRRWRSRAACCIRGHKLG